MHQTLFNRDTTRSTRRGLSFVEFLGCLMAMVGGIVIGSMYLGCDLKTAVIEVVEKSDIVDLSLLGIETKKSAAASAQPAELATDPTDPAATSTTAAVDAPSAVVDPAFAEASDDSPGAEEEATTVDVAVETDNSLVGVIHELTDADRRRATIVYWRSLQKVMRDESQARNSGIKDPAEWQLFDYLEQRRQGHEQAVEKMEQLNEEGVDERLLTHSTMVLGWHERGATLFEKAMDLISNGPTAELSGPYAQSWQSAATQHRMEEKLVLEKNQIMAGYLEHLLSAANAPEAN